MHDDMTRTSSPIETRTMTPALSRTGDIDERGSTALEYGLIAALISIVMIGALTAAGISVSETFNTVALAAGPLGSMAGGGVGGGASAGGGLGGGASGGSGVGGSFFGL